MCDGTSQFKMNLPLYMRRVLLTAANQFKLSVPTFAPVSDLFFENN